MLISRYIQVMPSIGRMSEAGEQIWSCEASFQETSAISAKVGEAARPSQAAASGDCQARPFLFPVLNDMVIFACPFDVDRFRSLQN